MKTLFLIAALCIGLNYGYYFQRTPDEPEILLPTADITPDCLGHAALGSCAFYTCLEERFRCGADGYTLRISKHFCDKIDAIYRSFDDLGRDWLNSTSICLVGYTARIYNQSATTCQDIEDAGTAAIIDCNERSIMRTTSEGTEEVDFCDFVRTNKDQYSSLMGMTEMRLLWHMPTQVWSTMITQAFRCGWESFLSMFV